MIHPIICLTVCTQLQVILFGSGVAVTGIFEGGIFTGKSEVTGFLLQGHKNAGCCPVFMKSGRRPGGSNDQEIRPGVVDSHQACFLLSFEMSSHRSAKGLYMVTIFMVK